MPTASKHGPPQVLRPLGVTTVLGWTRLAPGANYPQNLIPTHTNVSAALPSRPQQLLRSEAALGSLPGGAGAGMVLPCQLQGDGKCGCTIGGGAGQGARGGGAQHSPATSECPELRPEKPFMLGCLPPCTPHARPDSTLALAPWRSRCQAQSWGLGVDEAQLPLHQRGCQPGGGAVSVLGC